MGGVYLPEVIAEREIEVRTRGEKNNKSGPANRALIRIGKPVPDAAPGGDWCCSVQIDGLGDGNIRHAYGQDSLQALQLAVRMIRALLNRHRKHDKVAIKWLGLDDSDRDKDAPSDSAEDPMGDIVDQLSREQESQYNEGREDENE